MFSMTCKIKFYFDTLFSIFIIYKVPQIDHLVALCYLDISNVISFIEFMEQV